MAYTTCHYCERGLGEAPPEGVDDGTPVVGDERAYHRGCCPEPLDAPREDW